MTLWPWRTCEVYVRCNLRRAVYRETRVLTLWERVGGIQPSVRKVGCWQWRNIILCVLRVRLLDCTTQGSKWLFCDRSVNLFNGSHWQVREVGMGTVWLADSTGKLIKSLSVQLNFICIALSTEDCPKDTKQSIRREQKKGRKKRIYIFYFLPWYNISPNSTCGKQLPFPYGEEKVGGIIISQLFF